MRRLLLGAALLSVAACASVPTSVHLDAGKSLLDAIAGLDAAETVALAAVNAHVTSRTQDAQIAALTAPCPPGPITLAVARAQCPVVGGLAVARAAYAATDTTSFTTLTANLVALTAQLAQAHP